LSSIDDDGTQFVFKKEDTDGNFECMKECDNPFYSATDQHCLDDCSSLSNPFINVGTIGANGDTAADPLYNICVEDTCPNSTTFIDDGTSKTCVDECAVDGPTGTKFLLSSTTDANGMTECVSACEANEYFISDLVSHSTDDTSLTCMDTCPTTASTKPSKYKIAVNFKGVDASAQDFYD